jgi:hypothetical protein
MLGAWGFLINSIEKLHNAVCTVRVYQLVQHYARIARAERDGTRAEIRFGLSPKWTSPFKSVGASVQSTAGSRGVRMSLSNAGYTTFGGGVRVLATHSIRQFPLHFPSRASPCAIRFRTSSTYLYSQAIIRHVSVATTNIIREDNITNQSRVWLLPDICNRPFIRRPAYVHGFVRY